MSEHDAQMSRKVEIPESPVVKRLKSLGLKGKNQGLSAEEYIQFVELLEHHYIVDNPTWLPGAQEGWSEFRNGQNDLIRFIRKILSELPYKTLEGVV